MSIAKSIPTIDTVAAFLERFAPLDLAEEWDNVGLLVGNRQHKVNRMMTCLTITPTTVAEAIREKVALIATHHPLPFRSLKTLTSDSNTGRLLLALIEEKIGVYSPHTAFDSAPGGINQRIADGLQLVDIQPIVKQAEGIGAGRFGFLSTPVKLTEVADRTKSFLDIEQIRLVGNPNSIVRCVGIGCGAADEFIEWGISVGCDCMLIGEARFHACLKAEALNIGLLLPGHFASERFAVECLADILACQFEGIDIWASRDEKDPIWTL